MNQVKKRGLAETTSEFVHGPPSPVCAISAGVEEVFCGGLVSAIIVDLSQLSIFSRQQFGSIHMLHFATFVRTWLMKSAGEIAEQIAYKNGEVVPTAEFSKRRSTRFSLQSA